MKLPVGKFVKASAVRQNKDGTISVILPGGKSAPKKRATKKRKLAKKKAKRNAPKKRAVKRPRKAAKTSRRNAGKKKKAWALVEFGRVVAAYPSKTAAMGAKTSIFKGRKGMKLKQVSL